MPRKYSKKRSYRRRYKRSRLSKSKIFSKTSAKSQASQIYALKKKINYVYRNTKPDIDTVTGPVAPSASITFTNNSVTNYLLASMPIIDNTTLGNLGQNLDFIYIRNIRFHFLYRFNAEDDTTQPLYIRLTFLKLKQGQTAFPAATTIFNGQADPYIKVRGPLRDGLYDTGYKIVGDYKFKITKTRPNLDFKVNFRGFKLEKGNSTMPKGTLVAYVYLWNPNYGSAPNHAEGQAFFKLAYSNPSKLPGQA